MPYRATPMPYRTQASAMVGDIKQPQTDPPPPPMMAGVDGTQPTAVCPDHPRATAMIFRSLVAV